MFWARFAYVEACWAHVGPMLAHVGPMLGHVEPKFGNVADFGSLKGSTALGIQSLPQDLGLDLPAVVETDSSSSKGTARQIGLEKARRVQARTSSHERAWEEQSGRRADQERVWGRDAQHNGKIRIFVPDRAGQGSDEAKAIGLMIHRPCTDSTRIEVKLYSAHSSGELDNAGS